jgi:hypothetical protein
MRTVNPVLSSFKVLTVSSVIKARVAYGLECANSHSTSRDDHVGICCKTEQNGKTDGSRRREEGIVAYVIHKLPLSIMGARLSRHFINVLRRRTSTTCDNTQTPGCPTTAMEAAEEMIMTMVVRGLYPERRAISCTLNSSARQFRRWWLRACHNKGVCPSILILQIGRHL